MEVKKCFKCGELMPIGGFGKDASRKDGKQFYCRKCVNAHARMQRKANPEKVRSAERERIKANPEKRRISSARGKRKMQNTNYINLSKMFGPACADCGRACPMQIFDYHHINPTAKTRKLRVYSWNWARVKAYVERGVVQLCPTCHRLRHVRVFQNAKPKPGRERFHQWRVKVRDRNYANLTEMFGPACIDCGREHPMQVFDYHHLDPATKTGKLELNWSWKRVRAYAENVTVQLCPTCHQLRHFTRRKEWK